ncbi:unnamed protein product [Candidula unifasciata]|uniref:Tetraspanin n=1 Tax=Candidula unifasciata TaxID=100452 RepID=A0A8S3YI71_9EUPU|nr:unnamed protein product [Candidula unifasciata]
MITRALTMLFNSLFWINGVILLGYGVWMKAHLYKYVKISSSSQPDVAFLLIGVGAFIVLISCLGCCCTIKGYTFFMYMYAGLVFVVIIIELCTGIMLNLYRDQFQCCGIRNYTDWFRTGFSRKQTSPSVPTSCCRVSVKNCRNAYASTERGNFAASDIYTEGCLQVLVAFVEGNVVDIRDIDIGLSFFQVSVPGLMLAWEDII